MRGCRLWRLVLAVAFGVCLPMSAAAQDVVEYYGTDAIGSVRIVFDAAGNVLGRMDYGPFGEQLFSSTMGHRSYAGLFRDGEAGLDYAEARSYQVRTGRFSSPDPVYAGLFAPQGWNRYSYALNSPLTFVDPTGLLADSCVMKSFVLDGGTPTMAYDCSVTGSAGGGPSWDLSLFNLSGTSFFGQGRGSGAGSAAEPRSGRGRQPTAPKPPAAPGENTEGGPSAGGPTVIEPVDPSVTTVMVREFVKGCGEGAAIVADVANPFGDPFETLGYYNENTPGVTASTVLASISIGILEFATGTRGAAELTRMGPRGSVLWKMNNNPYARVGYSMWPRTQGRIPRLAFGTGDKFHYDLRFCGR